MRSTVRPVVCAVVGVVALVAAVLTQRPEPAVIAAPFLTLALVSMSGVRPPPIEARVTLGVERVLAGEVVQLRLAVASPGWARVVVRFHLPNGVEWVGDDADDLDQGGGDEDGADVSDDLDEVDTEIMVLNGRVDVEHNLRVIEWGAISPVVVELVVSDRLGLFSQTFEIRTEALRSLPHQSTLRSIVSPRSLRTIAGMHLSRHRGDGIEFADTRIFVPGDRARSVNWRVSARRPELWVDDRRPERSGEVVIFLDTFVSVGDGYDTTLRRAVEIAAAVVSRHIGANDRVGLVDLGGVLRWVRPGGGTTQLYRIVEALTETEVWATGADKSIDVLPVRALPRRSMVLALTPLMDPRGIEAIMTMRARGFDVAVIEVDPASFVSAGDDDASRLAYRLWQGERSRTRDDLRSRGIAVSTWADGEPLDPVFGALDVFRNAVLRSAR